MSHRRVLRNPRLVNFTPFKFSPPVSSFTPLSVRKSGGCNYRLRWRERCPRDEKRLALRSLFQSRPRRSQRVTRVTFPNTSSLGYTVHRLLFHNCGYFDEKVPLDRRYSIPRWLSYFHPPLPDLSRFASPFFSFRESRSVRAVGDA